MKPRVVILSAFLSPFRSGAEACVEEVSKRLADRYEIIIVTARLRADLPKEEMMGNVRVVRVGGGHWFDKWLFPVLGPLMAQHLKPVIVHAVLESYAGFGLVLCRWMVPRAKRLLTCQSTNTTLFLQWMHRNAHRITVISSALVARARRLHRDDAVLIPNGIEYAAIRSACDAASKVPGRILFVGRLEHMKGVDTLLAALFSLLGTAAFDLHIVGDGSERIALESQVQTAGMGSCVTFTGYLTPPALYKEYAQAEIFCGLSRSEALGNVFLEAQAAGCAVIATDTGGIPDIVQDGATGQLVPPNDPAAAAQALRAYIADPQWMQGLAIAGTNHARAYDWNLIAEQYAQVYAQFLS